MKKALEIILQALGDAWADLWTVLVINLIWLIAQLLIVPGPPATMAIFYFANRAAHGEVADLSDFFKALRGNWGLAWRWGLLNYALLVILIGDFFLMGNFKQATVGHLVQGFYLTVLFAWLLLQLFALPFLSEQETPGIRLALRNGAVMIGKNLVFSLALGVFLAILLAAGVFIFMLSFAFGGMILASAGNHAVIDRLKAYQIKNKTAV